MSEPVGNAPRGASIGSNAHRVRESTEAPKPVAGEEVKPVEKLPLEGKVIITKPPWWKKFGRSMFADDASSVGSHLVDNVVVPGIKQMAFSLITGAASQILFGRTQNVVGQAMITGGGLAQGPVSSVRNRYDLMADGRAPLQLTQNQRARHAFNEIVLADRNEAEYVLQNMIDRIMRYGTVSVADLYTFLGVSVEYQDRGWGWTDLSTATLKQVPAGWQIDLPGPMPFRS